MSLLVSMDLSNPSHPKPRLALAGIVESYGVVTLAIVLCVLAVAAIWWLNRANQPARSAATLEQRSLAPIVGSARVSEAQLDAWQRAHGPSVTTWIENHERILDRFADENMAIDLTADLSHEHELLGPVIEEAIAKHPQPSMRAELSGLVVASRNTLDALRRSNWTRAKKEHVVYIGLRDRWTARLRASPGDESHRGDATTDPGLFEEPPSL